jgi:ribosomal protein S18 acetylase RimI-like enzyme
VSDSAPVLRRLRADERALLIEVLTREWTSPQIVSRGRLHDASLGQAIGAFEGEQLVGLATYEITHGECEVLTLNAFESHRGVGSALLEAVAKEARDAGCRRLWLTTTNDNTEAIGFYESHGLRLVTVHHGAMDGARRLKPSIPEFGTGGVRISDELEFELDLAG